MPTGGKNVREHDVVVLTLLGIFRQYQAIEIGIRDAQQFGLTALIWPHLCETISGAGSTRIGCKAESGEPLFTVFAEPAADIERQADPVTDLDPVNPLTDFNYLTEVLMAKYTSDLKRGTAFVHVQVRTADVGSGNAHQHIRRFLDFCVRYILDRDVPWAVVHDCFHAELPKLGAAEIRPTLFRRTGEPICSAR